LAGLGNLSLSHQQAVKTALLTGQVQLPSDLSELTREADVLMGTKPEGVSFELLHPIGTIVRTVNPTFRWRALEGASSYIVNIYDTKFNKVASSPKLSATHWTITSSLQHGTVYIWQVTADKDGVQITFPVKPAPEARFKILDKNKADELERMKRTHPNSHLIMGTLYAQAGLVDEAEKEFRALHSANLRSAVVEKLLRTLRR
jgi:hypothetical protein